MWYRDTGPKGTGAGADADGDEQGGVRGGETVAQILRAKGVLKKWAMLWTRGRTWRGVCRGLGLDARRQVYLPSASISQCNHSAVRVHGTHAVPPPPPGEDVGMLWDVGHLKEDGGTVGGPASELCPHECMASLWLLVLQLGRSRCAGHCRCKIRWIGGQPSLL